MAGRITAARQTLHDALAPILPGRVYPYPAESSSSAAPGVYVSELAAGWNIGQWVATFRVLLVADGVGRAAHAQLDELCDAVYDACAASADCYPDAVQFDPVDVNDGAATLPAYSFTVAVDTAAATWCAPEAPAAVPIPVPTLGV